MDGFNSYMQALRAHPPHMGPRVMPAQVPVQPTNVLGAYGLQQQGLQNNYAAQMQQHMANMGGMAGLAGTLGGAGMLAMSDARLKTDVREIGSLQLPGGPVPIKTFRYHGDPVRRMGMVAQDVEKVDPQAVFTHPVTGFKGLNYARVLLGAHQHAMGGGARGG